MKFAQLQKLEQESTASQHFLEQEIFSIIDKLMS